MTSSLVGSEMCIRDSLRTLPPARPERLVRTVSTSLATRDRHPPARREPVSYTHLTLPTICSV
eukprot:3119511-Prorocentrum_lima.AAC.1